jgi:hypothetical protein
MGRHLHGIGWCRDREIGECLTAAVQELSRAPGLAAVDRAEAVRQAVTQLDTALALTDDGLRPPQSAWVTDFEAKDGAGDERV